MFFLATTKNTSANYTLALGDMFLNYCECTHWSLFWVSHTHPHTHRPAAVNTQLVFTTKSTAENSPQQMYHSVSSEIIAYRWVPSCDMFFFFFSVFLHVKKCILNHFLAWTALVWTRADGWERQAGKESWKDLRCHWVVTTCTKRERQRERNKEKKKERSLYEAPGFLSHWYHFCTMCTTFYPVSQWFMILLLRIRELTVLEGRSLN